MSAAAAPAPAGSGERAGLQPAAWAFLTAVAAAAAAAVALSLRLTDARTGDHLVAFATLAVCAAAAQLFVVHTPRNQGYHTTAAFLIPAAFLLPPYLAALVCVVAHVPEWIRERYPWYIQGFNIANYTLDVLAAALVIRLVPGGDVTHGGASLALAGALACVVFVTLNHLLLAAMLRLARGHTLRETGLLSVESISTDLALAALGVVLAFLGGAGAWLLPIAICPLVLVHRSLSLPNLEAQARVDPKTGLFNARHFRAALADELGRAERFGRPVSLLYADLDLLRTINNTYGHLAGDAVLAGVAEVFRAELRDYDVAARLGGEEFAVVLPETTGDEALAVAERIRAALEARSFVVDTSPQPLRATVSCGVATVPDDACDATELQHRADLAMYEAKAAGRNRVVSASWGGTASGVPHQAPSATPEAPVAVEPAPAATPRPVVPAGLLAPIALGGLAAGAVAVVLSPPHPLALLAGLIALLLLAEAFAVPFEGGALSVSGVAALAAALLIGPGAALPVALATAGVAFWRSQGRIDRAALNAGAITLATLAAAGLAAITTARTNEPALALAAAGPLVGVGYFLVNTGLLSGVVAVDRGVGWRSLWRERFAWLLPHYVAFGALAAALALAVEQLGLAALGLFTVPLACLRLAVVSSVGRTATSSGELRRAAEVIQQQNGDLEHANALLRERSTRAMEGLSATVDARDPYTAGHSRRVQRLALALARELELPPSALEAVSHAALFHDIGKLAVPDAVLLKADALNADEWQTMRRHAEEGAAIISRLGFLDEAIPSIRHHHERYDGGGYPDGLPGISIPLGARIIHLADALDSMVTTRVYRHARSRASAVAEVRSGAGRQFCPACVAALDRLVERDAVPWGHGQDQRFDRRGAAVGGRAA